MKQIMKLRWLELRTGAQSSPIKLQYNEDGLWIDVPTVQTSDFNIFTQTCTVENIFLKKGIK